MDLPFRAFSGGPGRSFQDLSSRLLREYVEKIRLAAERLDEDEVWSRPAPGTNSVGNLLLHLSGNLSLWILASIAGEAFRRNRAAEFAAERTHRKEELLGRLEEIVRRCRAAVEAQTAEDLARPLTVQGYETDRLGAIYHAVEHMGYHTGQIVMLVKQRLGGASEFEFYPQHRGE